MLDTKLIKLDTNLYENVKQISKSFVEQINKKRLVLPLKNRLIVLDSNDVLRAVSEFVPKNEKDRIAQNILIRTLYHAEQQCHGAAWLLLNQIAESKITTQYCCKLNKNTLKDACEKSLGDNLGDAFFHALEHGGPAATINVENEGKGTYIRISDELVLPGTYPVEFGENVTLDEVFVVVFDGVIEKISEINRLLEELNQKDQAALIFARGYGYEVVSTLLHNWRIGKLKVIPVSANIDTISEFAFFDLPKVLSDEPQFVNQIPKLEDLEPVNVASLKLGRIAIQDRDVSKRCQKVSSEILKEINEMKGSTKWIIERTKKISSRCITINVGEDQGESSGILTDRINSIVRFIADARIQGVANVSINNEEYIVCKKAMTITKSINHSFAETLNIKNLVALDGVA